MSLNLDQDVTNLTAQITAKTGVEAVKIAGKLAKELLLLLFEKVKEESKYKSGLVSLKKLLKSGEELQSIKLSKEHLQEFHDRAKLNKIAFAAISSDEDKEARIYIKSSQVALVKDVMEDILKNKNEILKAEQAEKGIVGILDKYIDIPNIHESENIYRHKIENVDIRKAQYINEQLKANNIKADISVDARVNELSREFNNDPKELMGALEFKVAVPQKEKAIEIIDNLKEKSLEELKELSQKLMEKETIEQTKESNKEDKLLIDSSDKIKSNIKDDNNKENRKSLDNVIESAKSKTGPNMSTSKTKVKTRTQNQER